MTSFDEEGYILAEAIVAFAILSLALVALYQSMGTSYRAETRAELSRLALSAGDDWISSVDSSTKSVDGGHEGSTAFGIVWLATVEPLPLFNTLPTEMKHTPRLLTFVAKTRSGEEILRLVTVKLVEISGNQTK